MGELAGKIRRAVRDERFVVGDHADERLKERRIVDWQVVAGLEKSKLLLERSDGEPHPVAEFQEELADGTPIKARANAYDIKTSTVFACTCIH